MPDEATQTKAPPAPDAKKGDPRPGPAAAPTGETPTPRAARPNAGAAPPPAPVKATFAVGIAGAEVRDEERLVGADEPPPLPPNAELKSVGKPVPRLDGRLKVTGAAKYTADVKLPGMLHGVMITSPHAHARIKSIDTSAAEKHPGVRVVHILDKLVGVAQMKGEAEKSKYPLVRFAGQPIAGLAATSRAAAEEAARLVKVDYEELPFAASTERAREEDAPIVFEGQAEQAGTAGGGGGPSGVAQKGNVRGPVKGGTKDVNIEEALKNADVVVEAEYRTQVQTHSALETHGVVADWKPDLLTVYASTQGTSSVRDELAAIFGLAKSKVRVITEFMGGGFGAKFGAGNFGVLATHLSKKAGAPVKLMLSRKDEHLSGGNRPDSVQKVRIGAKKDGTLVAVHLNSYGTAGVGTGAGTSGPVKNLYPCPAILTEEFDVFTHAGPAAAFRAPGHPQGAFAYEQAVDELAHKLDMDPCALRDKIDVGGDRSDAHREERRIGAERIGWSQRHPPGADTGPVKRGMGMAQSIWYRFTNKDSNCEVRITKDGSVELLSAVQDIGGGIRTALAQVVAEELGLRPEQITIKIGDTAYPAGPSSGGSVTTGSITPPAREAAWKAKQQLLSEIAPAFGVPAEQLVMADGKVFPKDNPEKGMTFRAAASKMQTEDLAGRARRRDEYTRTDGKGVAGATGGVQFAQVAVDTETGHVKVEHVVAVHDCGRPINPLALESQINGGVIQGVSYALFENRVLNNRTGRMVNGNLEQYKIAGVRETPKIEALLIEQYLGRSSTDAAGIGEPATVATSAAVANAVYNAIGVRIRELPITPARVLAALEAASKQRSA
jgi:xanthine dehydrogenase YagR molybdenum-binding subunit